GRECGRRDALRLQRDRRRDERGRRIRHRRHARPPLTRRKTKCTERDSVTYSASPACLHPGGLPAPRRSFVCFRLSVRCETDSRGTGGARASRPGRENPLAAGKALPPSRAPPETLRIALSEPKTK